MMRRLPLRPRDADLDRFRGRRCSTRSARSYFGFFFSGNVTSPTTEPYLLANLLLGRVRGRLPEDEDRPGRLVLVHVVVRIASGTGSGSSSSDGARGDYRGSRPPGQALRQKSWFSPAKIAETDSSEKTFQIVSARRPDLGSTVSFSIAARSRGSMAPCR